MLNVGDGVVNKAGTVGKVTEVDDLMAKVEFGPGKWGWFSREGDDRLTLIEDVAFPAAVTE